MVGFYHGMSVGRRNLTGVLFLLENRNNLGNIYREEITKKQSTLVLVNIPVERSHSHTLSTKRLKQNYHQ